MELAWTGMCLAKVAGGGNGAGAEAKGSRLNLMINLWSKLIKMYFFQPLFSFGKHLNECVRLGTF